MQANAARWTALCWLLSPYSGYAAGSVPRLKPAQRPRVAATDPEQPLPTAGAAVLPCTSNKHGTITITCTSQTCHSVMVAQLAGADWTRGSAGCSQPLAACPVLLSSGAQDASAVAGRQ